MENRILFRASLRRHRGSLSGVFVLLFLVSLALGTVLTVWSSSNQYISDELNRTGFGTITAWVSNVSDLDGLAGEISSLPEVDSAAIQPLIFSNYEIKGEESDSEGQLITLRSNDGRYRFFTDDLAGYQDVPGIAPGEVWVSPSLISMFGVEIGDEVVFPIARAGRTVTFTVKGFYEDPIMGSSMIGIPQHQIEAIARCIMPDILAFYESEEGQREFAEWKERREVEKQGAKIE